jgi:hypothetical protein
MMSKIEFHCPGCSKLIRAPEGSGGRHGKCPSCGRTVYIPTPSDELEEYDIAPLDDGEERRQQELQREASEMNRARLLDKDVPDETRGYAAGSSQQSEPAARQEDVRDLVIAYLSAMVESRLDEAGRMVQRLRPYKKSARVIIQQLSTDDLPPAELSSIPLPLMHGFLKSLNAQL